MTNTNPDQEDRVPIDPDKEDADAASLPLSGLPEGDDNLPAVVQDVDTNQIKQFITQIRSAEHQVGEHIINALQDPDTVAVLTTVVIGPKGGQHIVSAGLDPETLEEVQKMLVKAEEDRHEDIPCVGFHCFLKRKPKKEADGDSQT
ncbi:MAG: hypothetical protein IIA64_05660 [Planctomycetes bacterium]|nr:hypothetical protein [Planctomycetota bacterium]